MRPSELPLIDRSGRLCRRQSDRWPAREPDAIRKCEAANILDTRSRGMHPGTVYWDLDDRIAQIRIEVIESVRPWQILLAGEVAGGWNVGIGLSDFSLPGLVAEVRPEYAVARNPLLAEVAAAERYADQIGGQPDRGRHGYQARAIEYVRSRIDLRDDSPYLQEFREDGSLLNDIDARLAAQESPSSPDSSAQETFARMLKGHVAPGMRGLGFVGSGTQYRLPSTSHRLVVAFSKSKWNSSTYLSFEGMALAVAKGDPQANQPGDRAASAPPSPRSGGWQLRENLRRLARVNPSMTSRCGTSFATKTHPSWHARSSQQSNATPFLGSGHSSVRTLRNHALAAVRCVWLQ